jgi:large subunit ribosomal protein L15
MKLHDLAPAEGAHRSKTRVGRGIAAGKGKTAGRGTKGQKARAGGSIPPWFEGGQTPLHMRIPKLRGFRNRGKVVYEVVNVGDIAARIEAGAFDATGTKPKKGEPMTVNADILRAVGLVRDVKKPLKILGNGELGTALFVVADAFTKSATEKIQAAGGSINVLEVPATQLPALGVDGEPKTRERRTAAGRAAADQESTARARRDADAAEAADEKASKASAAEARGAKAAPAAEPEPAKAGKGSKADGAAAGAGVDAASGDAGAPVEATDPADEALTADEAEPLEATEDNESVEAVTGDDTADGPAADGTDEATTDSSTDESA